VDLIADLLGVHPDKIEGMIDRGMLPGYGLRGATDKAGWRIREGDLVDYLLMLCRELGSEADQDRIIERIDPLRRIVGLTTKVRFPPPPTS
jgi:hypothetical protein